MTEAEILAYYEDLKAKCTTEDEYADRLWKDALRLRYSDLPPSCKVQVDTFSEEQIFQFIKVAAKGEVDGYHKAVASLETIRAQHGEDDPVFKGCLYVATHPPIPIIERAAGMRRATFHDHFHEFLMSVQYDVTVLHDLTPGKESARIRVNLTLLDCYRALNVIYHPQGVSDRDQKRESGIITEIPQNVYMIVDKEFRNALSPYGGEGARIAGTPPEVLGADDKPIALGTLFDPTGKATMNGVRIFEQKQGEFKKFTGDPWFIQSMYTIVYDQWKKDPEILKQPIKVSRSALCKHLGMRHSDRRRTGEDIPQEKKGQLIDVNAEIGEFTDEVDRQIVENYKACRDVVGIMPDGSWYYLLTFHGYDAETDSYVFMPPFLTAVAEGVDRNRRAQTDTKGRQKFNPNYGHSALIHGDIRKGRNNPAKSILAHLIAAMHERGERIQEGEKGEKVVKYHTSCKTIVDAIPELSAALEAEPSVAEKNRILKRAFSGVIDQGPDGKRKKDLFREFTDAYTYFKDLRITWNIPNYQTLASTKILIQWKPQREAPDKIPQPTKRKK